MPFYCFSLADHGSQLLASEAAPASASLEEDGWGSDGEAAEAAEGENAVPVSATGQQRYGPLAGRKSEAKQFVAELLAPLPRLRPTDDLSKFIKNEQLLHQALEEALVVAHEQEAEKLRLQGIIKAIRRGKRAKSQ